MQDGVTLDAQRFADELSDVLALASQTGVQDLSDIPSVRDALALRNLLSEFIGIASSMKNLW